MYSQDILFARRSIRSFTDTSLSKGEMEQILKAAYAAPAGMGRYDSLHISVVTNRDFLAALEDAVAQSAAKHDDHPLYGASALVILSSVFPGIPTDNSSYSNTAIISQNIALAATAMGLGACHIWGAIRTLNTRADLLEKLHLPAGFMPCCAVALGHTDETYAIREIPQNRIATTFIE